MLCLYVLRYRFLSDDDAFSAMRLRLCRVGVAVVGVVPLIDTDGDRDGRERFAGGSAGGCSAGLAVSPAWVGVMPNKQSTHSHQVSPAQPSFIPKQAAYSCTLNKLLIPLI